MLRKKGTPIIRRDFFSRRSFLAFFPSFLTVFFSRGDGPAAPRQGRRILTRLPPCVRRSLRRAILALAAFAAALSGTAKAAEPVQIQMPGGDPRDAIEVIADSARSWREGSYEVWLLQGRCEVRQGGRRVRGSEAVLWVDRETPQSGKPSKVLAYFEAGPRGQVQVEQGAARAHRATRRSSQTLLKPTWFGRFHTWGAIRVQTPRAGPPPRVLPEVYRRGREAGPFRSPVQLAQHTQPIWPGPPASGSLTPLPPTQSSRFRQPAGTAPPAGATPLPPAGATRLPPAGGTRLPPADSQQLQLGGRSIILRGRGSGSVKYRSRTDPNTNETIVTIPSPVNIVLDDVVADNVQGLGAVALGKIDIEADSVVIWTRNIQDLDLFGGGGGSVPPDFPIEFYLEGNIVFRQGETLIYAQRMYYNVTQRTGVVLEAEMLTPAPEYEGLVRLKAEVLQQIDLQNYQAFNAAVTTSRLGVPRYWIQSRNLQLQHRKTPLVDPFSQQPVISPATGEPQVENEYLATSYNNFIYVGGNPVFYWPVLATDLTQPTYYVEGVRLKNDNIFGFQVMTDLNLYQLLGIRRPPPGSKWTLSADYLSQRGPAGGTNLQYEGLNLFGVPGRYRGLADAWGVYDQGVDSLGADRLAVPPPNRERGRVFWQHRQQLPLGYQLTAELGLISDRNFLEQFLESEWDQQKDQITGIELKTIDEDASLALSADVRLNDFFTQTEWLPRLDHFVIGRSLLFDRLTWHAHSHVGYAKLRNADLPPAGTEPAQASPPWELSTGGMRFSEREGLRAASRQEVDLPFQLGPAKIVPYGIGEVAYWKEDRTPDDVTRLYGQVGVRSSLPIWRADRSVRSPLFNLNGLAHKITLESEVLYADANRDFGRFPLYDPIQDDAQEHFTRRFIPTTFGGTLPARFDPRTFLLRSGIQSWVSSPTTELAEDLMLARAGVRQRWQTKRGVPGQERIVDWLTLDVEGVYFPRPDRDNFGEQAGLLDYDFRWHLGDRFTILSDGFVDIFGQGLRTFTLGGLLSRPERGSLYVGFRTIEGPITSNVVTAALNYRLSEKWIAEAATSFDFGPTGNIGQRLSVVRIGEAAFVRVGVNIDEGRDNIGVIFSIEPRLLPRGQLGMIGGVQIPPPGARGLE